MTYSAVLPHTLAVVQPLEPSRRAWVLRCAEPGSPS
jgi:hypothetical protein